MVESVQLHNLYLKWRMCSKRWHTVSKNCPLLSFCTGSEAPQAHTSTVWDLAFDPSGNYLASCSDDRTVKVWKCVREGGEVKCSLGTSISGYHDRTVFALDWSAAGFIATACADNTIRVFSVTEASGEDGLGPRLTCELECKREAAHPLDVNCVRWHPKDPQLLASAGDDGSIRIWRVEGG